MKKTVKYFVLALVAAFTSCSSSDDVLVNNDDNGNPSPINTSYWPHAIGNKWNYININDFDDTMVSHFYKTIVYEGKTYFQLEPINVTNNVEVTGGTREDSGVFYELHGASSQMGVSISAGTIKSIDTKAAIGTMWTDQLTLTVSGAASGTIHHINKGKIIGNVANLTVNGKNYQDVLKTELTKTINNSIAGSSVTIKYEDWLAKGIGPVYRKTTYYYGTNEEVIEYHLTSHTLN